MKVSYDKESDALYVQLNDNIPDGVVEIQDEINLDVSEDGKIYGIEILNASNKIDLHTLYTYTIDEETVLSIK